MEIKKAIEMIDEYLLEPNNISKDWIEVLQMCRTSLEFEKEVLDWSNKNERT